MLKRAVVLAFLALFLVTSFSALAEDKAEERSPNMKKWLESDLTFKATGYSLDTVMSICKKLTGANIMFELGTDPSSMPKITYRCYRFNLERVLNDVLAKTEFSWQAQGDKITIVKKQY
jgi:hypothetical protein